MSKRRIKKMVWRLQRVAQGRYRMWDTDMQKYLSPVLDIVKIKSWMRTKLKRFNLNERDINTIIENQIMIAREETNYGGVF
jgi:hypothetical protein